MHGKLRHNGQRRGRGDGARRGSPGIELVLVPLLARFASTKA